MGSHSIDMGTHVSDIGTHTCTHVNGVGTHVEIGRFKAQEGQFNAIVWVLHAVVQIQSMSAVGLDFKDNGDDWDISEIWLMFNTNVQMLTKGS
jgi:hypothetical protein